MLKLFFSRNSINSSRLPTGYLVHIQGVMDQMPRDFLQNHKIYHQYRPLNPFFLQENPMESLSEFHYLLNNQIHYLH